MNDYSQLPEYLDLRSRIDDLIGASERGELQISSFLTPMQRSFAEDILKWRGVLKRSLFCGGYSTCERARLIIMPSFVEAQDGDADELCKMFFSDEYRLAVRGLRIQGSGYRSLTHKDHLGSILSLGIERNAIGDVVLIDEFTSVVFCSDKIFQFLDSYLERVANDKVTLSEYFPSEDFDANRRYLRINDTVASERLDSVAAALCGISREKAQTAIRSGMCALNYITEYECDTCVTEGAVISIRGYGKYILRDLSDHTRKGRIRLVADKYI